MIKQKDPRHFSFYKLTFKQKIMCYAITLKIHNWSWLVGFLTNYIVFRTLAYIFNQDVLFNLKRCEY